MSGIKINGVTLFLGKLPERKQHCFFFQSENICYPVAYVPEKHLPDAADFGRRCCLVSLSAR